MREYDKCIKYIYESFYEFHHNLIHGFITDVVKNRDISGLTWLIYNDNYSLRNTCIYHNATEDSKYCEDAHTYISDNYTNNTITHTIVARILLFLLITIYTK